jgi:transcriptional regulator with XRE-family HTH domain
MDESPSAFLVEFCRRVARRRRLVGKTQREVAKALRMHRGQYSRFERMGYRSMQLEQLATLARELGTSADYLLLLRPDDPGTIPPLSCPAERPSLVARPLC